MRQWRAAHEGTSLWWYVQARNKKSVTVNLRKPEGQEIVRRLARDADIVIENFRPGTLEKWGLGYDALAPLNPGLIMVRLSGFGQTGPYRDQPGFGAIGESMGGMRHVTGFPDRPPVRMDISIGDALASLHGVIGALMALHHRDANGGQGAGGRRGALRSRVQHDGEPGAGVRPVRRNSPAHRHGPHQHRAVEYLSRRATARAWSSPATATASTSA